MVLMCLFRIAVACGLLLAPVAMAPACAQQSTVAEVGISDCHEAPRDSDRHEPAKSARCGGICSAIEVAVANLCVPLQLRPAQAPATVMASLPRILLDFDTPPPR